MTPEEIIARASSAQDIIDGYMVALDESTRANTEFQQLNEVAHAAMLRAQQAVERLRVWSAAVDRLDTTRKFLEKLESN